VVVRSYQETTASILLSSGEAVPSSAARGRNCAEGHSWERFRSRAGKEARVTYLVSGVRLIFPVYLSNGQPYICTTLKNDGCLDSIVHYHTIKLRS